jgi:hypothetical protein
MIARRIGIAGATMVIAVVAMTGAGAQASTQRTAPQSTIVGHLGITEVECDCTFDTRKPDARNFRFRSNPVALSVARRGPSAGILFPGDTIVDIDGVPLRTASGGSRFANVRPGQRVSIGLKRAGQALRVAVTAGAIADNDPMALGHFTPRPRSARALPPVPGNADVDAEYGPPTPRAAPRARETLPGTTERNTPAPGAARPTPPASTPPRLGALSAPPDVPNAPGARPPTVPAGYVSPRGWFGFSIRCHDCGWAREGRDTAPHWESSLPPEIGLVAPGGPAAAAGFQTGDRITHIDGESILEPDGARRFGAVVPGQQIRLTVSRLGTTVTRQLRLGERPHASSGRRDLRYTGRLRDVDIEVWSAAGASVERDGDTITISVGGSTVRLSAKSPRARD